MSEQQEANTSTRRSENPPENFSVSELRARGWTRTLIERFLPQPDAKKPNPRFRSTAPMKLYRRERVEAIEATEEFWVARRESEFRKSAAKKAVATKTALTLKMAKELPVNVPQIPLDKLLKLAVRHYEALHDDRRSATCKPWGEVDAFRDRICVNYLRHSAIQYHENLEEIAGKTGKAQAYLVLWQRIGEKVKAKYPMLAAEFDRQYREHAESFE